MLQAFVAANEDASQSPNFQSQATDPLGEMSALLSSPDVRANESLLPRVLKSLKILSRKYENRIRLGPLISDDLVQVPFRIRLHFHFLILVAHTQNDPEDLLRTSQAAPTLHARHRPWPALASESEASPALGHIPESTHARTPP